MMRKKFIAINPALVKKGFIKMEEFEEIKKHIEELIGEVERQVLMWTKYVDQRELGKNINRQSNIAGFRKHYCVVV